MKNILDRKFVWIVLNPQKKIKVPVLVFYVFPLMMFVFFLLSLSLASWMSYQKFTNRQNYQTQFDRLAKTLFFGAGVQPRLTTVRNSKKQDQTGSLNVQLARYKKDFNEIEIFFKIKKSMKFLGQEHNYYWNLNLDNPHLKFSYPSKWSSESLEINWDKTSLVEGVKEQVSLKKTIKIPFDFKIIDPTQLSLVLYNNQGTLIEKYRLDKELR